ncbi:hypothetical protein [Microbacterium enclense]|nr:hypothetical protein [Microbacterium enclense]
MLVSAACPGRERLSRAALVGWEGRPEVRAVLGVLETVRLVEDQRHGFAEEASRAAAISHARSLTESTAGDVSAP